MKQVSLKKTIILLRLCIITAGIAVASLFLLSFSAGKNAAADLWKQLGISQQQGSEKIRNSFVNGYLDHYGVRNIKNIASVNRAAVAQDLLNYTKTYVSSAAFREFYRKEKSLAKPAQPEEKKISKEDIRKEKIEMLQKGIRDAEAIAKQYPDMAKSINKNIAEFNRNIKEFEKPDNKVIEIFYQGEVEEAKRRAEDYEKRLKEWEQNYPSNADERIKVQLEKYLSIASTVDFDAALKDQYGKKVFVNKTYEGKNDDWKMIFRAGKEVYNVTKPFAEKWLKEL